MNDKPVKTLVQIQKYRAQRIDPRYVSKPSLPLNRLRWLSWSLPVLGIALVALIAWRFSNDTIFEPGPLSFSHAGSNHRCEDCHDTASGKRGLVSNAKCRTCHDGPLHNMRQLCPGECETVNVLVKFTAADLKQKAIQETRPVIEPRCASCHTEHKDRVALVKMDDNHCVQCHSNLGAHRAKDEKNDKPLFAEKISNFSTDHPEFKVVENRTGDTTPIYFNHETHMKMRNLPRQQNDKLKGEKLRDNDLLQCTDCHSASESNFESLLLYSSDVEEFFEPEFTAEELDEFYASVTQTVGSARILKSSLSRIDLKRLLGKALSRRDVRDNLENVRSNKEEFRALATSAVMGEVRANFGSADSKDSKRLIQPINYDRHCGTCHDADRKITIAGYPGKLMPVHGKPSLIRSSLLSTITHNEQRQADAAKNINRALFSGRVTPEPSAIYSALEEYFKGREGELEFSLRLFLDRDEYTKISSSYIRLDNLTPILNAATPDERLKLAKEALKAKNNQVIKPLEKMKKSDFDALFKNSVKSADIVKLDDSNTGLKKSGLSRTDVKEFKENILTYDSVLNLFRVSFTKEKFPTVPDYDLFAAIKKYTLAIDKTLQSDVFIQKSKRNSHDSSATCYKCHELKETLDYTNCMKLLAEDDSFKQVARLPIRKSDLKIIIAAPNAKEAFAAKKASTAQRDKDENVMKLLDDSSESSDFQEMNGRIEQIKNKETAPKDEAELQSYLQKMRQEQIAKGTDPKNLEEALKTVENLFRGFQQELPGLRLRVLTAPDLKDLQDNLLTEEKLLTVVASTFSLDHLKDLSKNSDKRISSAATRAWELLYPGTTTSYPNGRVILEALAKACITPDVIVEPNIPVRWMNHSVFNHDTHRLVDCRSCHKSETSSKTSDVLLPGIKDCQSCHDGATARKNCLECHAYHDSTHRIERSVLSIDDFIHGGATKAAPRRPFVLPREGGDAGNPNEPKSGGQNGPGPKGPGGPGPGGDPGPPKK